MKLYVTMTDKFMSGWAHARGMINKYIVICDNWDDAVIIEKNARKRSEMKYININITKPKNKPGYLLTFKKFSELGEIWTKE